MRAALLLLVAAGATNPVTRVVELLKKLQTDARADQEAEQKTYDKYACWCETTTKRKAAAIDQAKADIRTASNDVLGLRGKRATLASEIEDHADDIHDNEDTSHQLTLVRQKGASDAQHEITKMQQTVGALETAIRMVELKPGLVATKVDTVLKNATGAALATVDHPLVKKLASMLQSEQAPAAGFEALHPKLLKILKSLHAIFSANTESEQGTETTARETFTALLAEKTAETKLLAASVKAKENLLAQEAQALAQREQELLDLHDQMDADKAFFDKAVADCTAESNAWDERNRRRNEELSGIGQALELLTDDATRANFQAAMSFVQLRQSVAPLASSKSPKLVAVAAAAMTKTSAAFAEAVKKAKQGMLTKSKAKAKDDGDEEFDAADFAEQGIAPVITAIDEMITELKDEEEEDITQRDWCIAEQTEYQFNAENLTYDIRVLDNKITKLTKENAKFNEEIDELTKDLAELAQEVSDASDLRSEQNAAYNTAKAQDEEAQRVLNETLTTLEAFYDNNNLDVHNAAPTASGVPRTVLAHPYREYHGAHLGTDRTYHSFAQVRVATHRRGPGAVQTLPGHREPVPAGRPSDDPKEALRGLFGAWNEHVPEWSIPEPEPQPHVATQVRSEQPEFDVSEDDAPETVATNETYGGNTQQTKAILDLIQMLVDNLGNDLAEAFNAENKSESDYQAFMTASGVSKLAMETRVTNLENAEATNLDKISGHEGVKETTNGELDSTNEYLASIAPNCDWIRKAFYTRLGRRKQEMDGLFDAKSLLSGGTAVSMAAKTSNVVKKALNVETASTDQLLDSLDQDYSKWSKRARMAELVARHKMWQTTVAKPKKHGPPKHHAAPQEHAVAAKAKAFLSKE